MGLGRQWLRPEGMLESMDLNRYRSAAVMRASLWVLLLVLALSGCTTLDRIPEMLPAAGYVDSDGLQIHYQRFGQGPPLVLVHGWGADIQSNWVDSGWIEALSPYRTVLAIDVRGHGRSDKPHALAPYSYAAMSQDVLAVLDAHQFARAELMGYSMGSFIGAHLLGHVPERFSAMVLGGIGDETAESAAQGAIIGEALRAPDLASVEHPLGKAVREFVEASPANDLLALAYSAEQMWPEGYPLRIAGSGIANAQYPVLIVNGENDHPYVGSADRLAAALPNGRHVRIPGEDHLSVVADPRFKTMVLEFLRSR